MKTFRPISVIITGIFILINALFWLVLGFLIAIQYPLGLPETLATRVGLTLTSLLIAGFLIILFVFLQRANRAAYILSLLIFIFTILLTIFDDFGLGDLVILVFNIVPIFLLIKDRKWYFQPTPTQEK